MKNLFLTILLFTFLGCQTPPESAAKEKQNTFYIVIWEDHEAFFEKENELKKYLGYFKHRDDYKVEKVIICGHTTIFEKYD